MTAPLPISRQVARVLLLDPRDRVLLFRADDPADPEQPAYWYLPGGGMRDGETPAQAARRELVEETGIGDVDIGPVIARLADVRFQFGGRTFKQDEWHLLAHVRRDQVGDSRAGDVEAAAVRAHRWWSLDDLAGSDEIIYPRELPTMLRRLLSTGPPEASWDLPEP